MPFKSRFSEAENKLNNVVKTTTLPQPIFRLTVPDTNGTFVPSRRDHVLFPSALQTDALLQIVVASMWERLHVREGGSDVLQKCELILFTTKK